MLVLSRKPGELIVTDNGITIKVMKSCAKRVQLGISAPEYVRILRGELAQEAGLTPPPLAPSPAPPPQR